MALVPQGAHVWPNPVGAAPGLAIERPLRTRKGTAWTLVLPGVPEELIAIWTAYAEPFLSMLAAGTSRARTVIELHCAAPEADIAPILAATQAEHDETRIGSYPRHGRPDILVRIDGHDPERVQAAAADLKRRLEASGIPLKPRAANP
jgi:molybdopterin-biosynthesis enzyme MoeA-like protein